MTDTGGSQTAQQQPALPLFYRKPEALNPAHHGGLGITSKVDFAFAKSAHAIPVAANEMPMAMRSYPVVFVGSGTVPVVITGARRDENLFIEPDGGWTRPHYVPAYVRRYPFVLAQDDKADRMTLCVDRESKRIVETASVQPDEHMGDVTPLFDGSEPSEATRKALEFCQQFQRSIVTTQTMVEKVATLGLFAERRSTMKLEDGEVLNLTDFQVIDETALNGLADADFLELRKSGALAMIYCHLASMNSWASLVHQAHLRGAR